MSIMMAHILTLQQQISGQYIDTCDHCLIEDVYLWYAEWLVMWLCETCIQAAESVYPQNY